MKALTTEVFGRHGVSGVRAASHATKVSNFGIEHVVLPLNVQLVQVRKREVAILKNAQASTTVTTVKPLGTS